MAIPNNEIILDLTWTSEVVQYGLTEWKLMAGSSRIALVTEAPGARYWDSDLLKSVPRPSWQGYVNPRSCYEGITSAPTVSRPLTDEGLAEVKAICEANVSTIGGFIRDHLVEEGEDPVIAARMAIAAIRGAHVTIDRSYPIWGNELVAPHHVVRGIVDGKEREWAREWV
jgi:hypothetical protein